MGQNWSTNVQGGPLPNVQCSPAKCSARELGLGF
jgi:hypothetical protein